MIYAIQALQTPYIKIGIARGSKGRLTNLQVGCPYDLVLVAEADWHNKFERVIHDYLTRCNKHIRGEWFDYSGETKRIVGLMKDGGSEADLIEIVTKWAGPSRLAKLAQVSREAAYG